ncbi:LysR family transcriptional regulator [Massilia sp. YIM B04103]|uniref:LysR family transcriptional regulator n=1 Tax=Massilia sp. YIM B04103 TaxID=2963106 RepID=UPI0021096BDC|nr:LysR family transcriptional regulator [Massilia sp. YIM B04103]
MRLSLKQLQVFVAVADSGSTAAGADAVALSQSAASAALNELERQLRVQLFDRVGKKLLLNDSGRQLLPQARQMLDAALQIEGQFQHAHGGTVRIAASTTIGIYLLPPILARMQAEGASALPSVRIENSTAAAAAVAAYQADFGLIEGPCREPELLVEPWQDDELIIVCAPRHPITRRLRDGKAPVTALEQAGWLLREAGSGTADAVDSLLLPHLHHLRAAAQFGNSEAIKHAAAAGLGLACLPRLVVADLLALGRLVELHADLPPLRRQFYLIRQRGKSLSRSLEAVLDACRAQPL